MTEYFLPQQTDSEIVTLICPKCQGLIIEGQCVRCHPKKAAKKRRVTTPKPKFKAVIGFCPGCERDGQRITQTGFCSSCNLHGKQHEERLGEVEAKLLIKATYERVRLRMGTNATKLG